MLAYNSVVRCTKVSQKTSPKNLQNVHRSCFGDAKSGSFTLTCEERGVAAALRVRIMTKATNREPS